MNECLYDYYRCPEGSISLALTGAVSEKHGYFRFGNEVLYGSLRGGEVSASPDHVLRDVSSDCSYEEGTLRLPFDAAQIVDNLRYESYAGTSLERHPASSLLGRGYYFLRPILPVALRRHLQKIRLNGWRHLGFPNWPVDHTVDNLHEELLFACLKGKKEIPFIWFWPHGASSCAIMTHDVETAAGREFSSSLMDVNLDFGIKASFQIVPEERYGVPDRFLDEIRDRGFEINVQDLNHDGHLFRNKQQFLSRVVRINDYGRKFGAEGFRSAILYRRQDWYNALEFSYDMTVPNVAHLDPQHGGCCTVMPYFVGRLVELPVTTTQDYSLFHILEEHSIELWRVQIDLIMAKHGLMNFIIHPDYIVRDAEMETYKNLLRHLTHLAVEKNVWMPLPREVASWWRDRAGMKLVQVGGEWKIQGKGSERARIAYASDKDGELVYSFRSRSVPNTVGIAEQQC